jgi:glycosyltransferase involved in cell wall biosynthesis
MHGTFLPQFDPLASASPLVSVVIPAYNAGDTVAETLESVCRQTYRNLQIIVVDDGSTDATAEIIERQARLDSRILLIRKENEGVAKARNTGIQASTGEYLAPVDSDDVWHPSKIEKQMAVMLAAPDPLGFVYCPHRVIDEAGNVVSSSPLYDFEGFAFSRHILVNFVGNGSTPLFLKSAVVAAGGYDSALRSCGAEGCEDALLQMQVCRHYKVAVVPEYLVGYRRRAAGMSSNAKAMTRSQLLVIARMLRAERELEPWPFRYRMSQGLVRLALEHGKDGDLGSALRFAVRAIKLDPGGAVWSSLTWRTSRVPRRLRRRLRALRAEAPRSYWDVNPLDQIGTTVKATASKLAMRRMSDLDRTLGDALAPS